MYPYSWNAIINANWPALVARKKIWLDVHPSLHPRFHPPFRANVGWPDGQTCDFTISYTDGSRLHAQCFGTRDGLLRLRLHRDVFDPDHDLINLVLHGLFETPFGPAVLGVIAAGAIGAAAS